MAITKKLRKELTRCRIVIDFHSQIIMLSIPSITGSWDLLLMEKYCIVRIRFPIG